MEGEDGKPRPASYDRVLVAVGRQPNGDVIGAAAAGLALDERGFLPSDGQLRTNVPHIFSIGDVRGAPMLAHKATHEGKTAAEVIAGHKVAFDPAAIPSVAYTDPEVASIGLTEDAARATHGGDVRVYRHPFDRTDRAIAEGKTTGLIKVMVVKGRPVGASIVGHQAGELISTWSLALANGLKMSQIAAMVAPYPTIGEINKRVAGAYFSPRLFDSKNVKRAVRFVQRWIP